MNTSISVARTSHSLIISVKGKFCFEAHHQFRKAYHGDEAHANHRITHFTVDLSETHYLDSSALGMLLLLREEALAREATILLSNPRTEIRNILETANFHQMFEIESCRGE
ncbi:MAG: STAS domain-containing protein [Magnetococcales bacterium]|nr:STAS domain-containing protein [Magnetococcales bacterium]MBF0114647.1 STAS domain-containing protein [Magnetococcales bacterium]